MVKLAATLLIPLLSLHLAHAQQTEKKLLSQQEAVAAAEKFVAAQGYTGPSGAVQLKPGSVGARLDSGLWFVGFRSANSDTIRGVIVNAKKGDAKLVSQNLKLDWLQGSEEQTAAPVSSTGTVKPGSIKKPAAVKKQDKGKKKASSKPAH